MLNLDPQIEGIDKCCLEQPSICDINYSLSQFTGLETLELRNATAVIDEPLLRQLAKRLKRLAVHSDQHPAMFPNHEELKQYLSVDAISVISRHCLWLHDLSLDVPRDEEEV